MTNDKKNINELVTADDDPTAELEVLVLRRSSADVPSAADVELESAARTAGFENGEDIVLGGDRDIRELQADLQSRSETIDRLQFELTQLQAKWLGLETELESRELVRRQLQTELTTLKESLTRKQGLLKKRDRQIKDMRLEIRQRNQNYEDLQAQYRSLAKQLETNAQDQASDEAEAYKPAAQAGQLVGSEPAMHELQQRYLRIEEYADQLRQKLQDRDAEVADDRNTSEFLQQSLLQANDRNSALQNTIVELREQNVQLNADLESLHAAHAAEVRMIRFELGEAQETVAQHELLTEQLASDLVETRTYRVELENMLNVTEENSKSRIEKLELENRGLRRESSDLQQKLESKNEAINCLISELAKKSQQMDSIEELEDVIHEIDDRVSSRISDHVAAERDRVTRLLIGSVDNQELRFPLFKDRLTIGRTEQNDIQLKASHISRRHAVIVTEGSATRVIDWGSKNGVFVNSHRVTEHFLKHGDVISIGTAEFRYEERPKRES